MLLSVEVFLQLAPVYLVEVIGDWLPSPGRLALSRRQLLNTKYGANVCHIIAVVKICKMNVCGKKNKDFKKVEHKESEGMAKTEPQMCHVLPSTYSPNYY